MQILYKYYFNVEAEEGKGKNSIKRCWEKVAEKEICIQILLINESVQRSNYSLSITHYC